MKTIELLLLENVPNLGIVGDVVHVKPGYARNYLLPRGLASKPSDGAVARLAERRKHVQAELAQLRKEQEALIGKLEEYELTMQRAHNDQGVLYGGVTQHDIAEALREEDLHVEDRFIRIGEKINRLDTFEIPVVIDKELKAEIKLWVVSDRPAEELETDDEDAPGDTDAGDDDTLTAEMEVVPKGTATAD
jgi:large subunit ribosomal protein L9